MFLNFKVVPTAEDALYQLLKFGAVYQMSRKFLKEKARILAKLTHELCDGSLSLISFSDAVKIRKLKLDQND